MEREFNYTGTCIPGKHYMVDISHQIAQIMQLIDKELSFTINRPRQYGKTTTLLLLERELLRCNYLPISISFEGIGETPFESEANFCRTFLSLIAKSFSFTDKKMHGYFSGKKGLADDLDALSALISTFVLEIKKEVVLIIDEVDKSSNNQLFLHFLGMLRDKYLLRNSGKDYTFHSVILAGVHDIKSIKLKLRPGDIPASGVQYNSPWNIAVDFKVDMSFSAQQIAAMLTDYADERKVTMDIPVISEKLRYYTSGHPFLVSKLCYIINSEVMNENRWCAADVEEAVRRILLEDNTNFQSLTKNLENNPELYELISRITLDDDHVSLVKTDPVISLAITYGILKDRPGFPCEIHNPIYSQLIYDHMMIGFWRRQPSTEASRYNFRDNFIREDNSLDLEKILEKFQAFMKEQYSSEDWKFLERNGRLIFLAFVKPIINGKGYDFKEVQISEEKRIDIIITYGTFRYIIELKVWRGEKAHEAGTRQLADYLKRQHCDRGYLVIFDFRDKKEWKQERLRQEGRDIFAVWV